MKAGHGQSSVVSLQARAGMPKVSSFGSLPRSLSDQSMRKRSIDGDRGLTVQPFTSQINKAESIASTAVRTADKINVSTYIASAVSRHCITVCNAEVTASCLGLSRLLLAGL